MLVHTVHMQSYTNMHLYTHTSAEAQCRNEEAERCCDLLISKTLLEVSIATLSVSNASSSSSWCSSSGTSAPLPSTSPGFSVVLRNFPTRSSEGQITFTKTGRDLSLTTYLSSSTCTVGRELEHRFKHIVCMAQHPVMTSAGNPRTHQGISKLRVHEQALPETRLCQPARSGGWLGVRHICFCEC